VQWFSLFTLQNSCESRDFLPYFQIQSYELRRVVDLALDQNQTLEINIQIHRYHLWLCYRKCIGDKYATLTSLEFFHVFPTGSAQTKRTLYIVYRHTRCHGISCGKLDLSIYVEHPRFDSRMTAGGRLGRLRTTEPEQTLPKFIRDTPMTLICLSNHPCIGENQIIVVPLSTIHWREQ